jgi:hypothetical protein
MGERTPMADILEQVYAVSIPRTTKDEVIQGYLEKYEGRTGKGGWKQAIVHRLAEMTGLKPKNLERRFDPSRIDRPEARNAAQYEELGKELPPMVPEEGYHIFGVVWVKGSDGNCEEREVDEYIVGSEARDLLKMSSDAMLEAVVHHYFDTDFDEEIPLTSAGCQGSDLTVEAIE